MDQLFIIGLALCFGLTYLLSVSEATAKFRATPAGKQLNNPILTGAAVGGLLYAVLIGGPSIPNYLVNMGVGALVGWGVLALKSRSAATPPAPPAQE